jgi:hypothetical protein
VSCGYYFQFPKLSIGQASLPPALAARRGAWTRWGRIHFKLVAAASATLAVALIVMGLV